MLTRVRLTPARRQPSQQARPGGLAAPRARSLSPMKKGRQAAFITVRPAAMAAVAAIGLAAGVTPAQAAAQPAQASRQPTGAMTPPGRADGGAAVTRRAACPRVRARHARCLALYQPQVAVNRAIASGARGAATRPQGWGAADIESAYRLPVSRDPHQTVAVVDAYSAPRLAADLATYRRHYGLPACPTSTGCLRIVNQDDNTSPLPVPNPGWGVEETLDVAMVSAACQHCKILVVEASSDLVPDLATAEDTAARLGAQVISNSYGVQDNGFLQAYARAYRQPGHTIVVASGDSGFTTASFPANLGTVTAVGGTQLARASNARGWAERVWSASGSGCSAYVAKPSWQHDPHCPGRTTADVAALAWNIAIYDSSLPPGTGPWLKLGGTSAAAPLIAGVYAVARNAATIKPGYPYQHPHALHDITTGNNAMAGTPATACGRDYLCVAKPGYDAPTGVGTPNGTGSF